MLTDRGMTDRPTDAGMTGILIAHPWAVGSGELKIDSESTGDYTKIIPVCKVEILQVTVIKLKLNHLFRVIF